MRVSKTVLLPCIGFCILLLIFQQMIIHRQPLVVNAPFKIKSTKTHEKIGATRTKDQLPLPPTQLCVASQINCTRSDHRYDLCSINGPTVLNPTTSTFFTMGLHDHDPITVEKIKPYPRKFEDIVMVLIKELTITSAQPSPPCQVQHKSPALVFSAGGYTGNLFHDFNDGFIPLFITVNSIYPNHQDFVMVISNARNWWISKYGALLSVFSKHPIIALENDTATHCFPSATLGLITHGFMTISQTLLPNSKTYIHFRDLLHKAYGHNTPLTKSQQPRLVLVSRGSGVGRAIINQKEVIKAINKMGFEVIVFKPTKTTSLHDAYALINSSHAMVGVHGAALTHSLFLRPGAVLVQVVPIGVEWASGAYFGKLARGLNLEYVEYRIGGEESSLVEKYGKDNVLLKNPFGLQNNTWPTELMNIYLKEQDVKLNIVRFKRYLKDAYEKAKKFMHSKG